MSQAASDRLLRVGELAEATGVTVRALHHYEDIALVAPTARSDAGHRLYGPEAVDRLYRVSLLRRLGLSLDQIGEALAGDEWGLADALRRHASRLDDEIARATELRRSVSAALGATTDHHDPTDDLLEVLHAMDQTEHGIRRRISILVYRDLAAAHDELVDVFGLAPGEITLDPSGTAVHAEVYAGDGVVWLHPETDAFGLASPRALGAATATMAVMVDDVDEHHRLVAAKGAEIVYEPVDQPYGYREYSARDREGHLWSFMKDLSPAS